MKKITYPILILCLLASCKFEINQPSLAEQNAKLVESLFEHFNKHDWEAMANLYGEDALFKDPAYGIELVKKSKAETIAHYTDLSEMFPNVHDEVLGIYPSGDKKVIVEFVSTGSSPDGASFELPICAVMTIENGK
ncbi:MAG: nuclear transport factor 2 family protein, partial [Bacteroidota bacterium]